MRTLTYSNTFQNIEGHQEKSIAKVLVESITKGHELVSQWNANSKTHCKGRYNYSVEDMSIPTKEELDTLNLY
jgi:hypothetical protein